MKYSEILNLSTEELQKMLQELIAKGHGLRQKAYARTLKQFHELPSGRRMIAQIKTILHNRATAQK